MNSPNTGALRAAAGFAMGAGHVVCEDYALASSADAAIAFAIVADGCSGSPGSDVGARILAHSCRRALQEAARDPALSPAFLRIRQAAATRLLAWRAWLVRQILLQARAVATALDLADELFDATLLCAFVHERRVYVLAFGDGGIRLALKDRTELIELKYASGAPCYLSYQLDEDRQRRYAEVCGGAPLLVARTTQALDGAVRATRSAARSALRHFAFSLPVDGVRSVTLFTDGLHSFQYNADGGGAPPAASVIARELGEPRNLSGEFVVRRMQRFRRDMERQRCTHFDDLAVATLAAPP